jgi:hypothetical protein
MGDAYFSSLPYLSAKFISVDVGRGLQTPPDGPARPRMSTQVVLPEAIGQQRSDRGLLRRRQQAIDLEQAALLGAGALRVDVLPCDRWD